MNAILLAAASVIILLIGGGVGYWIGRSGVGGGKARVEKAEAELEDYKLSVTKHFGQTAAHFQAIGKQYRELYEHMATGEQALCEPGEAGKQLLFAPGADVTSTSAQDPAAEAAAEAEVHPPIDYAESPVAAEAANAPDAVEETADEQVAETGSETENAETDVAEGVVAETAADSQPEPDTKEGEQTLH